MLSAESSADFLEERSGQSLLHQVECFSRLLAAQYKKESFSAHIAMHLTSGAALLLHQFAPFWLALAGDRVEIAASLILLLPTNVDCDIRTPL